MRHLATCAKRKKPILGTNPTVAPACRISPSVILLKAAGLFGTESKLSGKEGQVVSLGGIKRRGRFLDRVIHDAP